MSKLSDMLADEAMRSSSSNNEGAQAGSCPGAGSTPAAPSPLLQAVSKAIAFLDENDARQPMSGREAAALAVLRSAIRSEEKPDALADILQLCAEAIGEDITFGEIPHYFKELARLQFARRPTLLTTQHLSYFNDILGHNYWMDANTLQRLYERLLAATDNTAKDGK